MRRITLWSVTTVAILVLLFSYRTSTAGPGGRPPAVAGAAPAGIQPEVAASSAPPAAAAAPRSGTVTVNGTAVQTRWGPVQVQVKIASGKIGDVVVLMQPTGERRDVEINGYALPILKQQVLAAQSAQIDGVSGATVTSDGYRKSLQSALDAAHFGR